MALRKRLRAMTQLMPAMTVLVRDQIKLFGYETFADIPDEKLDEFRDFIFPPDDEPKDLPG